MLCLRGYFCKGKKQMMVEGNLMVQMLENGKEKKKMLNTVSNMQTNIKQTKLQIMLHFQITPQFYTFMEQHGRLQHFS